MEGKVEIAKIKQALRDNKALALKYELKNEKWGVYDQSLDNFGLTFRHVLPEDYQYNINTEDSAMSFFSAVGGLFKKYIEDILSKEKKKGDLTALALGGPESNFFSEFEGFFKKTIGVCLSDVRNKQKKTKDKHNNHHVITGDILDVQSNELSNKLEQELGSKKTDLIISRMVGGTNDINTNPAILDRIIRNWYSMLNENGLMFIQFEEVAGQPASKRIEKTLVKKWSTAIKARFPEIDIQVQYGVMRLHKKAGAPEKLPPATQLF